MPILKTGWGIQSREDTTPSTFVQGTVPQATQHGYNTGVSGYHEELGSALRRWQLAGLPAPDAVVVTGSTGSFDLGAVTHGPFELSDWLPFPVTAIQGHTLQFELLEPAAGRCIMSIRGRLHCYQGFDAHQVVFPIRLAALLGARVLILTNAAGSLRSAVPPGRLCFLSDHLNLAGLTPLLGHLPSSWGPQFPPLNDAYSKRLRNLGHRVASEHDLKIDEGVYAWMLGPAYETPAEITMLGRMGADLVGMSTVPEVIAARHLGVECLGLSLVTNLAAGMVEELPDHQEVLEIGRHARDQIQRLLTALIQAPDLLGEVPKPEIS